MLPPISARTLSPALAAVIGLLFAQGACSLRSLDYLKDGQRQDGATPSGRDADIESPPTTDATKFDTARSDTRAQGGAGDIGDTGGRAGTGGGTGGTGGVTGGTGGDAWDGGVSDSAATSEDQATLGTADDGSDDASDDGPVSGLEDASSGGQRDDGTVSPWTDADGDIAIMDGAFFQDADLGTGDDAGSSGEVASGGEAGGGSGTDHDLVLWYKFDESTGTTAADSAMFGGFARNGMLETMGIGGNASFSTSKQVGTHAVSLSPPLPILANGNGGYITVPSLQDLAPEALTIAVWVNLASVSAQQNWERIFDFGNGSTANNYLYLVALAPETSSTCVQFFISTNGHSASSGQTISSPSALTPNLWHHIAVVLPAGATYTGTLYVDGVAVASNSAMTLHASDIGPTINNWIGRSQFSGASGSNPLFNGSLDDFRVYKRALSAKEISELFVLR